MKLPIRPPHMDIVRTVILSLALGLLAVLFINQQHNNATQLQKLAQIANQQKRTLDTLATSGKQRTTQIHDLQNHIDCITALLQLPNRQSLVINDIENCTISADGSISDTPSQSSQSKTATSSNTSSSQTSPSSPAPATPPPAPLPKTPVPDVVQRLLNIVRL